MKSISYSLTRYQKSRHWAVWKHEGDNAPQLLCVTGTQIHAVHEFERRRARDTSRAVQAKRSTTTRGAQSIINELES